MSADRQFTGYAPTIAHDGEWPTKIAGSPKLLDLLITFDD
jgi:hypothetical protein